MKHFKFTIAAFVITCFVLIITTASKNKPEEELYTPTTNSDGFVIMELFTSQGCSSCPPADNLLGKYVNMGNTNIIPLAFHVDYWNRLGWTDSFSSFKYSQRQRDYAMIIDGSSVYTPQLVINGEKEFVGSDAGKISAAVNNGLKMKADILISIDKIEKKGKSITVNFSFDKIIMHSRIQAALVQKQVLTNILKGENRGLKLINYNVVRDFNSLSTGINPASISLNMPAGYKDSDFTIVLFVQDDASGRVIGAVQKTL